MQFNTFLSQDVAKILWRWCFSFIFYHQTNVCPLIRTTFWTFEECMLGLVDIPALKGFNLYW